MSQSRKKENNKPQVWAEISLARLKKNLATIRASVGRGVGILAIVKADAYGHGMKAVAASLSKAGVDFFGVANIDEAAELRKICPQSRILVLGSFHADQVQAYVRARITPTVSSLEDLKVLKTRLRNAARPFPVHIKIDTGMGRLGVWHEEVDALFRAAVKAEKISVEGLYTHFSNADVDASFTRRQIALFDRALTRARRRGLRPRFIHAANSTGVIRFRDAHLNLVRPGLILYGLNPFSTKPLPAGLEPVLSLKTRISFLKKVGKGRTVSYGATHKTARPTTIATLPVGYSHGYRVGFSNKSFVIVRGRRCPVVGRVTMDQTLVDVGRVPGVRRWDEVTLIGRDGSSRVTAEELAHTIQSIPYEIVCSVHTRIPRVYKPF